MHIHTDHSKAYNHSQRRAAIIHKNDVAAIGRERRSFGDCLTVATNVENQQPTLNHRSSAPALK